MSSIFDALKKLEDEKSSGKSAPAGGDLLKPPPGGSRGQARRTPWLIAILLIMAGGAYYFFGRGGEEPATPETVSPAMNDRLAADAPPAPALPSPAAPAGPATGRPVAAPAPAAPEKPPASAGSQSLIPTNVMTDEQKRARAELLERLASLRAKQNGGEEGEEAAPIAKPAPAPPKSPAPAPAIPPPAPIAKPAPAPKAVPSEALPAQKPAVLPAPVVPKEVPEPAPAPLVKSEVPMLMLTEVTYHRKPELRTARLRLDESESRLLREGDSYRGVEVKEIMSGAINVEVAGTEVVVGVGESLSFTVTEPDFH